MSNRFTSQLSRKTNIYRGFAARGRCCNGHRVYDRAGFVDAKWAVLSHATSNVRSHVVQPRDLTVENVNFDRDLLLTEARRGSRDTALIDEANVDRHCRTK